MSEPIFFAWTRSFWSAVVTCLLIIDQTGEPMIRAIAVVAAGIFGGDVEAWTKLGLTVAPLLTLAFAVQQRSGNAAEGRGARPYTLDPRAIK
jgi:hypothetical protein